MTRTLWFAGLVILAMGCSKPTPVVPASPSVTASSYPQVISLDGPQEDQEAINSWLAKLMTSFDVLAPHGVPSPFLVKDNQKDPFERRVFWDADLWIFPAIALFYPERARRIPEFRLAWTEEYALPLTWEVAPGPTAMDVPAARLHRSQTGSAVWMLQRAQALGLADDGRALPFIEDAWGYYSRLFQETDRGLEIRGIKSIDEYAEVVDNDLYTNLVAENALRALKPRNDGEWADPDVVYGPKGPGVYLPRDKTSLLTYDNDPVRNYQQAAAVLAIFPLQHPEAEKNAKVMIERFAPKTNPRGPAMTDSIHATIYARLGETDKAYDIWRKSWQDFQRKELPAKPDTPIDLEVFSEYRTQKRSYFLTGAAGCLNAVLYGFCGFRIDSQKQPGAAWTKQLKGGYWLSIKPQLPRKWRSITVPFILLGKKYTLVATHEKVTVN